MKSNSIYYYSAVMSAMIMFRSFREIAQNIVASIREISGAEVEVTTAKNLGCMLRMKKDDMINNADLVRAVIKGVRSTASDIGDKYTYYLDDCYDVEYDEKKLNAEFVDRMFDINKNGRIISIELDL